MHNAYPKWVEGPGTRQTNVKCIHRFKNWYNGINTCVYQITYLGTLLYELPSNEFPRVITSHPTKINEIHQLNRHCKIDIIRPRKSFPKKRSHILHQIIEMTSILLHKNAHLQKMILKVLLKKLENYRFLNRRSSHILFRIRFMHIILYVNLFRFKTVE